MAKWRIMVEKKRIELRRLLVKKDEVTLVVDKMSDIVGIKNYDIKARDDGMYFVTFECRNDVWEKFVTEIGRAFMLVIIDFKQYFELV